MSSQCARHDGLPSTTFLVADTKRAQTHVAMTNASLELIAKLDTIVNKLEDHMGSMSTVYNRLALLERQITSMASKLSSALEPGLPDGMETNSVPADSFQKTQITLPGV